MLAGLPRVERDVLALCAWSELSYEVGTVRSRLARARSRFGELYAGSGHELDGMASDEAQ
jgi:DNA-directed RNA polymerase specialized sigma24 family protein